MSFESLKSTVEDNLNPLDFARGFVDGAIHQPGKAIDQLRGGTIAPDAHKSETLATKAGNMAGFILDFAIVAKCSGAAIAPLLGEAAETTAGAATKMFVAGGIYGSVLTPSSTDRSLLVGRMQNGLVSASTFAVMGGVGKALEGTELLGGKSFSAKVISNAIGGAAGGVPEAYGSIYFGQHRQATLGEVVGTAGQYAALGAGFGALDFGLTKGTEKLAKVPAVESASWRAKAAIRDGKIEAKKMTYATLNKYDMRHPLQRLGDLVYGTDIVDNSARPALTAENNPIPAFENDVRQYFSHIDKLDEIPARGPGGREAYEQMQEAQKDFAYKLLTLWHGNADTPGIASHTDDELSTADTPAERVAQIRKALTLSAKKDYPEASPLTQALANLAGLDVPSGHNYYEVADTGGLSYAKEKYYNYDESELSKRMSMPGELYQKKRAYGIPVDWMPFEPTEQLPNLFHGTVSSSLPSIFTEHALLSSKELRLRGINQSTGESAGETFPRRAVSITSDFNEAWAYHRHSPAQLTDFPVVLGVSSKVTARAWPAGLLEPGETLVDKLSVGSSLATKLGLRSPEVTHMYVPDSMVPQVVSQMARYRVQGLQVIGLSDLQVPQWKVAAKIRPSSGAPAEQFEPDFGELVNADDY
jgi:hypothetical protein